MQLNYKELIDRASVGAFRLTLDGRIVECNASCARLLGYSSPAELIARGSFDYFNASDPVSVIAAIRDVQTLSGVEISLRKKDGTPIWVLENLTLTAEGGAEYVDGIFVEVTEQRLAAERYEHLVSHDPLTGLPNRALFAERLTIALAQARRHRRALAVMFVDLDHFELINTTFGPAIADRLLKSVGGRLATALRIEDTVARFGSDEFVIAAVEVGGIENAGMVARRILDSISKPETLDSHDIYVNASIGIAMYPEDGADAETLIKNADSAMYRAKQFGRNTFRLYQPEANARAFERQTLAAALRRALDRDEFLLHYQPEVNVQTGKIEVIEALLRWRHPEMGLIEPNAFLPAAEEGQLINAIGQWVLRAACRQLKEWQRLGITPIPVAVNLSPRQFAHVDLIRAVDKAFREYSIDPSMLELEIAQRAVNDADRAVPTLHALKELGVRLAIDDFGTGRSSLADLKRMPIDTVKIDPGFIKNVTTQSDDAAIVEAVIRMARGFDLRVVAEGVETKDQMTFLWNRRCTEMQGFFFGRPLPATALEETLRMQH